MLSNWEAMAPCMDNWLRLGDPQQVLAYGWVLKHLTDPGNFEAFRFMPVTRDMSAGQRTLLYAFLDGGGRGGAGRPRGARRRTGPDRAPRFLQA